MRIQFASDLHLETRPKETFEVLIEAGVAPVLALLGDIAPLDHPNLRAFLEWCSERWEMVLYVPGKAELGLVPPRPQGGDDIETSVLRLREICSTFQNIQVLYRDAFYSSDGLLVLGCTFWSCYAIQSKRIRELHQEEAAWIWEHAKAFTNPILVLSHYGPVGWVQDETGVQAPEETSVFPQLELLLRKPIVAWMFGHLHDTIEYSKTWSDSGGTPHSVLLVSNGLGKRNPASRWTLRPGFRRDAVLGLNPAVYLSQLGPGPLAAPKRGRISVS